MGPRASLRQHQITATIDCSRALWGGLDITNFQRVRRQIHSCVAFCVTIWATWRLSVFSCCQQHRVCDNTSCSLLQHGFCRAPTRFCSEVHTHRDTDCLLHASLIRCVSIQAVRARHRKRQHRCVDLCFFVGERIVLWLFMPRRACFAMTCDGFNGYRVPEQWWS